MQVSGLSNSPISSFNAALDSKSVSNALPNSLGPNSLGDQSALDALKAKQSQAAQNAGQGRGGDSELREAFDNFVGQTFFSQMLASMRSTQKEAAYFHGGQAERIFQGQLDQILSEELTKASGSQISGPMFELFQLRRA